jgi:hypothetical protein
MLWCVCALQPLTASVGRQIRVQKQPVIVRNDDRMFTIEARGADRCLACACRRLVHLAYLTPSVQA